MDTITTPIGAREVPADPFTWFVDQVPMRLSQARTLREGWELLDDRARMYGLAEELHGTTFMLSLASR